MQSDDLHLRRPGYSQVVDNERLINRAGTDLRGPKYGLGRRFDSFPGSLKRMGDISMALRKDLLSQPELTQAEIEAWENDVMGASVKKVCRCPNCGSENTAYNEHDDGSHCLHCGARWSYPED